MSFSVGFRHRHGSLMTTAKESWMAQFSFGISYRGRDIIIIPVKWSSGIFMAL
jgi:hypothetical protein